jgi:hypothetical protein
MWAALPDASHIQVRFGPGMTLRRSDCLHHENHRPVCSICSTGSDPVLDRKGQSFDSFGQATGRCQTMQGLGLKLSKDWRKRSSNRRGLVPFLIFVASLRSADIEMLRDVPV